MINMKTSKIDPGHLKRLPSTCVNVGRQAQKTTIQVNVLFNATPLCPFRRRRTWYDTALGGYGALTGTLNGWDIETLANRLSSAGKGIQDAVTLQAKRMPTIWYPWKYQVQADTFLLNLQNKTNQFIWTSETNLSKIIDWTVCTLQTLYQMQQKNNMQTQLMTGNEGVWRSLFATIISKSAWI
ncbi:uncharacterized protein PAF06_012654 [Gastrophryne carolinensis]